ncbi:hypothetical protein F183_A21100 [Bryobacterales bacterium F-183]|nr:hypothetical protein F183_A21100 [Bryobacterales bacterium F-183]
MRVTIFCKDGDTHEHPTYAPAECACTALIPGLLANSPTDPESAFPTGAVQRNSFGNQAVYQNQEPTPPSLQRALALHSMAIERQKLGQRDEAIQLLKSAIPLLESAGHQDPDVALPIVNLLVALYLETGQTPAAKDLSRKALQLAKQTQNRRNRAQTWIVLSELERSSGNYGSARSAARNAEKLTEPTSSDQAAFFEGVQNQLARIAYETSDLRTAAVHWRAVLESMQARFPESDPQLLSLRVDIARVSVLEHKRNEAERELAEITRIAEEHGHQTALARGLYVLGTLYVEQKRPAKAEAVFLRSLTISDRELGELSADSALALLDLTKLQLKANEPGRALAFSSRSTKILEYGNTVPLVWLDVLQVHAQVLKKLSRREESKQIADVVSRLYALKRVGSLTIDVHELRLGK